MTAPSLFSRLKTCALLRNVRILYMTPGFATRVTGCPICGSSQTAFEYKNRYVPLDRCVACGHVFSRKLPGKRILNLMYGDMHYWTKDKFHQGITEIRPSEQWQGFTGARVGILERTGLLGDGAPRKFFEIGCSEGMVLHELHMRGHEVMGCEMNPEISEEGRKQLGVDIRTAMFEDLELPRASFDVVMSFHTIEHVKSPRAVFEHIVQILRPEGTVLIEVPCGPEEYNNTDHLHFFCEESLKRLIQDYFEETEVIDNSYTNFEGVQIGSLYGIGRRVKAR
ncbi:MAG: class I SAM-dependent methyltransferase [Candidatus Hydrogenedentes bacterium]|nr:class I SAM-dependent methyltransferase [Candidatus Hydrogenedentota bacterium]